MGEIEPELLRLIGAIYDAVIEPERWNDTVDQIRRHFQFHAAQLGINQVPSGVLVQASSNVPEPYASTVHQYGADALFLWGGAEVIAKLPIEEPLQHRNFCTQERFDGNPFYEQWAKPQGLEDQVVVILERNPRMVATISLGWHKSMPPIARWQIDGLRAIAPHLRRAAIISGMLDQRTESDASFDAVLAALGSAVVLIGEKLDIVYANERAERMLRAGDPITEIHGRLSIPFELVSGQLERAAHAAMLDDSALPQGSGIPVRRMDGSGMVVHLLPLKRRASTANWRAVAAVFLAEPDAELDLPLEALRALYGLRQAETRVLELIVKGMSGPKIAAALGVAPSTVKTHTLRLFEKVGVRTRADLLKLARASSLGPKFP